MRRVLLAEDDQAARNAIVRYLRAHGYEVEAVESRDSVVAAFKREPPGAAILDYRLSDGEALDVIPALRAIDARVPIMVLTGYGTIDLAVQALKLGAADFLTKPVDLSKLVTTLDHYWQKRAERSPGMIPRFFAGRSAAAKRLIEEVDAALRNEAPVLLLGETGTGKSRLAQHVHEMGKRAREPFVDVNCAGLSRELVESELFGHERGAFTGAHIAKQGLLEVANKGTLFLDEIGDIDASVQPKILKVVEEKRFRRMGDVRERQVDVRLIAATHKDLARMVRDGTFRSDLYYRVSTFCVQVPALRERREDMRDIVELILEDLRATPIDFERALPKLLSHTWPGNVRELRNVLSRALARCDGESISAEDVHLDPMFGPEPTSASLARPQTLQELEREAIVAALEAEDGRVEAAARRLGVPRSTLYQKLKTFGITSRIQSRRPKSGTD